VAPIAVVELRTKSETPIDPEAMTPAKDRETVVAWPIQARLRDIMSR
jgi:hypothetical protein